jgi:hypothetical protein
VGITYNPLLGSGLDFTGAAPSVSIGTPIAGGTPHDILVIDASGNLGELGPLTDGQLIIGDTGGAAVVAALTGTSNQVNIANGAGSITLSLPQDIHTTATPTFTTVIADVDKTGSLNIGGTNATTVNIGNSTSGADILGTLNLNTHLITNVLDPVSLQDAATKNFVDDSISALSLVYIPLTQRAANNGVATLDAGGKIPAGQLPNSVMEFKGVYDPNTDTPALANGTGNTGDTYVANAGSHDFGAGSITFADGDYVVYNGSIYQKSINSNNIASVNGQQGVVVLDTDDVSEGITNLYYTDTRVSTYLSGGVSTITTANLTVSRALASDASGKVAVSATTSTELGYVSGVTSAIQTQLGGKEPTITTLPVSKGGTNSSTALNDNRIMVSSSGAIVEAAALTNGQLLIGSTGAAPVAATIAAGTGISVTNGAGTITIAGVIPTGDIAETSFSAADGQAVAADVTGFAFANGTVRAFKALVSVYVDATTSLYEVIEVLGIQKGSGWDITLQSAGDSSGVNLSITSAGQMQYTSATYPGFASAVIKFRAQSLTV